MLICGEWYEMYVLARMVDRFLSASVSMFLNWNNDSAESNVDEKAITVSIILYICIIK